MLLVRRFGGATVIPRASGFWINGKAEVFHDRVRLLRVIAPTGEDTDTFFRWFGRQVQVVLRQEVVLMLSLPVRTIEVSEGWTGAAA